MMTGFDDLTHLAGDLRRASREVLPKTVGLLRAHGDRLADIAKSRCPHDTGRLAGSILMTVDPVRLSAEIGPYAYYGHFVEFGTSKMGPRPYMGPALDEVGPGFAEALGRLGGDLL